MTQKKTVKIHGNDYETVASRITRFRADHPEKSLTTELPHLDGEFIIAKATIANEEGRVLATGYSEEVRTSTGINKTSALENAETSAWGRALANYGYGGDSVASKDEIDVAKARANLISIKQIQEIKTLRDALAEEPKETARAFYHTAFGDKDLGNLEPDEGDVLIKFLKGLK